MTGTNNTFDRIDVDTKFMETPGTTQGRQGIAVSGDRATFKNGSTYNVVDEKGALVGASHVTFDNFSFHDVRATHELVHNECVFSLGPYLTIRNSRFWNCATMDLFVERGSWFGQPLYCCVTLENNVFGHSINGSGWHYYGLGIHGGDMQELRNWRVVNNTFESAVSGAGTPAPGTVWANNIGDWSCFPQATFVNNVGTKCSATDRAVSPASSCAPPACSRAVTAPFGWADPARNDFRLTRTSPAINRGARSVAPAADRDGNSRPIGSAPDAGAYEYGTGIVVLGERSSRSLTGALQTFRKLNGVNLTIKLAAARRTQIQRMRDVEVITVNSGAVTAAQTQWLRHALSRPAAVPRIVVLRQPPYSCGAYAGNAAVRASWAPLFRRYGVRLVVGGEDGTYQRFASGKTTYVVSGGGRRSSPVRRCPSSFPARRAGKSRQAFLYLAVDDAGIHGVAIGESGTPIDRFTAR